MTARASSETRRLRRLLRLFRASARRAERNAHSMKVLSPPVFYLGALGAWTNASMLIAMELEND